MNGLSVFPELRDEREEGVDWGVATTGAPRHPRVTADSRSPSPTEGPLARGAA